MEEMLMVKQLSKSYGGRKVVDNLTFSVEKGTVLGLLGANGAGKSTSMECILGTEKRDSGEVRILGQDTVKHRRDLFQNIGVQFQGSAYQREIRVDELCQETECLYKNPLDWRELLKRFGIIHKEKSMVKDLSGGERQRLFVALALIPRPKLVFLDELTTGLDTRARREVWKILKELKEEGLTIILTSHFMDEVEILCDRIIILRKGKTVFQGTVTEAKENSHCEKMEEAYLYYAGEGEEDEDIW